MANKIIEILSKLEGRIKMGSLAIYLHTNWYAIARNATLPFLFPEIPEIYISHSTPALGKAFKYNI